MQHSNSTKILMVLSSFDPDNSAQSVGDLLDRLGINRSTGFGLIKALVERGYLERVGYGHLQLGHAARALVFAPLERPVWELDRRIVASRERVSKASLVIEDQLDPDLIRTVKQDAYARKGPWRIGFANASLGNAWRDALQQSVDYGVALHRDSISDFRVAVAEDDAKRQAAQIDEMLTVGLDVLIISAAPDPGNVLAQILQRARRENVAIVALDRRPQDRRYIASFVTASDHMIGRISALWTAEHLNGAGKVWMLSGVEESSPARRRAQSARRMFDVFPQIEVSAHVYTNWTAEGGARSVENLLRRGTRAPDAVWCDSGLQGAGSIAAFQKAMLAVPPHTGGELNGMYKRALDLRLPHCALDYPAAMGAQAISVALDLMRERSVARRIETPVPVVMPRGFETKSVKPDIHAEKHVRWDLPDKIVLSQGPALRSSGVHE